MIEPCLAKSDALDPYLGVCFLVFVGIAALVGAWVKFQGWFGKSQPIFRRMKRFLGRDFMRFETHEKRFPGYDLPSVHRALTSWFNEHCRDVRRVGGCYSASLRTLFQTFENLSGRNTKPATVSYERFPVDVDADESFPLSTLWLVEMNPRTEGAKARGEGIAVLLSSQAVQDVEDDFQASRAAARELVVSVACRDRALADAFFNDVDARRRQLSIYRGKAIDPQITGHAIRSIGFRRLKSVREADLILPKSVMHLIRGSIVGFYNHQRTLRQLGVEMKRGVLFHSPPGTGKTSISLYLAGLLPEFTVCFVSGDRLLYPREVCRMARYLQPAMVVFEDIDLIAEQRDSNGLATVLGELMNQIDGCEPDEQVLFVMNTNSLERLEAAVRNRPGRVDQLIQIPLPDASARRQLLNHFAHGVKLPADGELEPVLTATDGATPATLKEIVKRATVAAVERISASAPQAVTPAEIAVTPADLLLATKQVQALRERSSASLGGIGFV
jgi:hypothetical protein